MHALHPSHSRAGAAALVLANAAALIVLWLQTGAVLGNASAGGAPWLRLVAHLA